MRTILTPPEPERTQFFIRNQVYRDVILVVAHEIWNRPAPQDPPVTSYRPDQELHPQ